MGPQGGLSHRLWCPSFIVTRRSDLCCDWPMVELMAEGSGANRDLRWKPPHGGSSFLHQQAEKRGRLVRFPV